ncbi:hypothetical protein AYL99_11583 [Fonsecaea erecta]|uniref:Uncharacterized protein n=1 Tax=Fonsecaea erecta TaxID=1367422 RepID=A0A178Z2M3_9EURO|nr:hypothetical protein AYL99_11583 [Fonsecaea erecta]OAP54049.1 hypothetical protein AYL99_11583 [Fonsecaea erecta]
MASPTSSHSSNEAPSVFSPTNKRKRAENSSSEEYVHDDVLGDIIKGRIPGTATYTDKGLDIEAYRVGGPELPMLPIRYLETPEDSTYLFDGHIAGDLVKILEAHSLWPEDPDFRLVTMVSQARPNAEPHAYAFMELQWNDGCQPQWIKAADAMRSKLEELGYPWIKVLLADRRAMVTPFSEVISTDDPLLKTWPVVANKILDVISLKTSWITLDLLRRGKEWAGGKDEEKTKVVLLIRYDAQDFDGPTLQECKSVISGDPLYQQRGVELEVIRGFLVGGTNKLSYGEPPALSHGDDIFNAIPYMGASICPDSYVGSGSFGCVVTLGGSGTYGLTACHVALPTSDGEVSYADPKAQRNIPAELIDFLPTGAALGTIPSAPVIKMPSRNDLKDLKRYYQQRIDEEKEASLRLNYVAEVLATGDPELEKILPRGDLATYKQFERFIERTENSLSKVNGLLGEMDTPRCSLGPLRCFSGFRKDEDTGMILNWALFPIDSRKIPSENRIPEHSRAVFQTCLVGYSRPLIGYTPPMTEEPVFKIGRTTGFTKGKINPAKSFVKVLEAPYTRVWPAEPGTEHQQIPELSRASAVCVVTAEKDRKFAGPGDSGAVVFNTRGEMKGLVVAGNSDHTVTYMTPSNVLVNDIKKMTGAKDVFFPTPDGPMARWPVGPTM